MQTRREFVERLSMLALAAFAPRAAFAAAPMLERASVPQDVIVVGAGLAGMTSALMLKQAGHRVTLVEAQARPGGRVLTARQAFADGLHGELGPARIPETHTRIRAWIGHFGLELEPFSPATGDRIDVVQGRKVRYKPGSPPDLDAYPLDFSERERRMGVEKVAAKWAAPFEKFGGDVSSNDWPPEGLKPYDAMTTRQYTRAQGFTDAVDKYFGLGFEDPWGSNFSALWIYRISTLSPFERPLSRLRGGLDQLPKAFAKELAGEIRYGAPVVSISQDSTGVGVTIEHNGLRDTLRAQRVVVTAPFPPLRSIDFAPALSAGKQRAIREMHYENLARVLLQLNSRPWEKDGLAGWAKTDFPSEIWHLSHDRPGPRALYGVYLKGSAADALLHMDEAQRIRYAAAHVDSIFPGVAAAVEGGTSKVWSEDHWTGGAHASLVTGQITSLMPHATSVEGRLHFAGEHTSPWQAWMEGALESGERAAREVHAAA
jgi:monoamine oxidase